MSKASVADHRVRLPSRPGRGRSSTSAGQAIVEFAILLPVALILLLGIGDFARLYSTAITVESAAREAADFGSFSGANWLSVNTANTWAGMQLRACTAASTLPDYQSSDPNNTCTNPMIAYTLENPDGIDCSAPVPAAKLPCVVHVTAHYNFRLFLGGAGIAGLFTFPDTVAIDRDASYVVNDFPSP